MNSPIMRALLDLDVIPADASGLEFGWERGWPLWLWLLLLAGCAFIAFWSYSRLTGRRTPRFVLATMRFLTIVLALVVLSGPLIELPRESIEQDWVLLLADRSASMQIEDSDDGIGRDSRDAQLARIIREQSATWEQLSKTRQVRWFGFHAGAFSLMRESVDEADGHAHTIELGDPAGDTTNLDTALVQAMQRATARPVSGIVLLSDGRTNDPPTRALLRQLRAEAIPVFVVPLGSVEPLGDLALTDLEAPARAYVRDKVPVTVSLDRVGEAANELGATIRLVDELTGETLDETSIEPGDERDDITLIAEPSLAGEATWRVVVETEEADLVPENNVRSITIDLIDRPLRVLFVDGYPRWEYRYLKNLMVRESSVESSIMLLSADRDFAQEGNAPITRLPRSPEEFAQFDVIILGDAQASFFSPDQLEMMRQHVAERGAGLLWIAGERHTPVSYAGTALADLLPIRGGLKLASIGEPINIEPTDLAERLGVLRVVTAEGVGWPRELTDPSYGWSQLYWAQRIEPGRLKPTAEVLAQTTETFNGVRLPIVTHLRYGAGQIIYVATDEIWRWRYGRGDMLPDQFWIQMIRMLGRESLTSNGAGATLQVNPRRLQVKHPLRVELRLLDAALIEQQRANVAAVLETEDGEQVREIELRPMSDSEDRFAATFLPDVIGQLRVRVSDPMLSKPQLSIPVEVFAPNDELRRPETDHQLLEQLAAETGGRVLAPAELSQLPDLLPNRSVRTENPLRERIWDTPLFFGLFLLLLTLEWIGRKVMRFA